MRDRDSLVSDILKISDWRHPYDIEGKPNKLAKPWFRDWHPWRWSIDQSVFDQAIGELEGKSVLDVACNDGWYGLQAARAGANVTGVDGRQSAIDRANLIRDYYEVPNLKYLVGDIQNPSILSGEFDITLFYGILYHLSDPIGVIRNIGKRTKRIMAVQTFIHALDREPTLHLLRECTDLPGKGLTELVTTPTQRSIVMMLREAGFDSVYRAMPSRYMPAEVGNSNGRWQWAFFYGVKGDPVESSGTLVRVSENDPPLNHFGLLGRFKGHLERFARIRFGRDTRGGYSE